MLFNHPDFLFPWWYELIIQRMHCFNVIIQHPYFSLFRGSLLEVFYKKVFLESSQNSQKNTCVRVYFLIKLRAKKETLAHFFRVNFGKFLRILFLQNTSGGCLSLFFKYHLVVVFQFLMTVVLDTNCFFQLV